MSLNDGNGGPPVGRPIVFGEVLFDTFADGEKVLGGAPFNVAWHLQGFGQEPLLVSRIGIDPLGEQVLDTMRRWGMDSSGMQRDPKHPTGRVQVTVEAGQPDYSILAEQAYDFIEPPRLQRQPFALLYHGSLVTRGPVSRKALRQLRHDIRLPTFMDVNLRTPWWEHGVVVEQLKQARWAKLNDEELEVLLQQPISREEITEAGSRLRASTGLELLVVTMGADGAWIFGPQDARYGEPEAVEGLVDTVGAGDAFSAVTLLGLLNGWEVPVTLRRALQFAARICQQRGATRLAPALYAEFSQRWQDE